MERVSSTISMDYEQRYTTKPRVDHVNVLGTIYTIQVCKREDEPFLRENPQCAGYCDTDEKLISLPDLTDESFYGEQHLTPKAMDYRWKNALRHEIVHAFLMESGLDDNAMSCKYAWSDNEEMIDWFAIQGPKIMQAWKECGCL